MFNFKRFYILIILCLSAVQVQAADLSASQLNMLGQLSDQEKAALAQKYGAGGGASAGVAAVNSPQTVQKRAVTGGRVESEMNQVSTDAALQVGGVVLSMETGVPVEKAAGQAKADTMELRQAFANFKSESKPLHVDIRGLKQFGYDLFAGRPTTFAPATDVPVPLEYVLGPGDELKVQLFGNKNETFTLVVDREGAVAFPDLGPLVLAGMRFVEIKAYIAQQVSIKMVGVSASVSMGKLRSIRIFALGEVESPGSYVVSGLATLSHALFVSGGVKKIGSLRNIQLKRRGKVVARIDLYRFLLQGDTSQDVRLLPGDVVFIPPIGKTAGIAGEVMRPAIYELKGKMNVQGMVKLAGGYLPKAYHDEALLERINAAGYKTVKSFALKGAGLKTKVQNGDVIKVFSTLEYEENTVLLMGNVQRPGKFEWKVGMKLSALLRDEKMLLPETLMEYGVIEREALGNREPELLRFSLTNVLLNKNGAGNMLLKARDKVFVFHRANFRQMPKVKLVGSVKSAGEYVLKKNMRVIDLVLASGGLLRDSRMDEAELYRTDALTKEVSLVRFNLADEMEASAEHRLVLQDLDRVVIHSIWEGKTRDFVRVLGEVENPDRYVFANAGMRLLDLVFAAGGLTEKALRGKAEITRYEIVDGMERASFHFEVDLEKALLGDEEANIVLQPDDMLVVRQLSNWRAAESVRFSGEIRYPGMYPIEEGERLSSLLQRTGGFTDRAYLAAAIFTRVSIQKQQREQMQGMAKQIEAEIAQQEAAISSIQDAGLYASKQKSLESAKRVLEQMHNVEATGRLVIELRDVAALQKSDFDLALQDGDHLHVPQKPDQVLVMGQVYNSVAMVYQKNMDVDDYVDAAGGMTRMADASRMYVVRANGQVDALTGWWSSSRVKPGDTIVVPEELEKFYVLDSLLDWSKVLMNIGIATASMKTIGVF